MSSAPITPTMPESFPDAPARGAMLDRFLILGSLGVGGMGVVLSAHDADLDRKVAIKLIRGDLGGESARDAILREAQAMARLQHPNVVAVYEVGFFDGGGYVVMEQVHGQTLRDWLLDRRTLPQVIDVMTQAGAGLAAAHRAGIVHRDFKPENVLVDDDGRARVSDFGLAAMRTDASTRAGTKAYMAPEQADGGNVDARADQYAYCVTLWEALFGERPTADRAPPHDRKAPAWLARAIARGLEPEPDKRWPSMDALLAWLRRRSRAGRPGPWIGIGLAAVAVAGGGAFVLGRRNLAAAACAAEVAPVWDDAARAAAETAFRATKLPYADDTFARVDAALRKRGADWATAHRDACEATHVRREQSEALLDLRMRCLHRARAEVGAMVALLPRAERTTVDKAISAVNSVGDVAPCADPSALAADVPPPRVDLVEEVEDVRQGVAHLVALWALGRVTDGLTAAHALVPRARATGYAPAIGPALFQASWFEVEHGDLGAGIDLLYETVRAAGEAHDDGLAAHALARLEYALGNRRQAFDAADVAFRLALAAADRAGNRPDLLQSIYHGHAATLYSKGDYATELRFNQLDDALAEHLFGPDDYRVAVALTDTADTLATLGRAADTPPLRSRAIAIAEKAFGPNHPHVAYVLGNAAITFITLHDLDAAAALLERALALKDKNLGPDDPSVAFTLHNLALVRKDQHRLAEARALIERAIRIREAKLAPDHPILAASYAVLASVARDQGKLDECAASIGKALAILHKRHGVGHPDVAAADADYASVLVVLGRVGEARAAIDEALAIDGKTIGADNPMHAHRLGALGAVLVAEKRFGDAVAAFDQAVALVEKSYGPDGAQLLEHLLGLSDALVRAGDGRRAVTVAERASTLAVATHQPADVVATARFHLAEARWTAGDDRPRAVSLARDARTALAALPDPPEALPEVDAWLARHAR
jgi:tetratricopeptide (TPR) repeat protein